MICNTKSKQNRKKNTKEKEENKRMGVWRELMKKEWLQLEEYYYETHIQNQSKNIIKQ